MLYFKTCTPVPELWTQFSRTRPKRSFSMIENERIGIAFAIENERFGLAFAKTGSKNSGAGQYLYMYCTVQLEQLLARMQ
jgi:hypothetical protein